MFRFAVMATETVIEGPRAQIRSFRMIRIPRLIVCGHMPAWHGDGIALDRLIVHHTRMASRAPFTLATDSECLHMLSMTHDKTHLFDRRGQISRRHFGCPKDMLMTTQTDVGMDLRLQVVSISRCIEQIDGDVLRSRPGLVMQPSLDTRPDMARYAGYLFV